MSEHWIDRLSDYIDNELDAGETADLEEHLASCAACRTTLEELRAVVTAAAALPDVPPLNDGWPSILGRIRADAETVAVLPFRTPDARSRRFSFSMQQLAAAAAVLIFASGGSVWVLTRMNSTVVTPTTVVAAAPDSPASPADFAASFVTTTTASYGDAVHDLEVQLQSRRGELDPATLEIVERNLATIDAAISEARAALSADPSNGYLYRHLDDTMMKKVELLRRAVNMPRAET
jgi:anti-sigma factor RsiW